MQPNNNGSKYSTLWKIEISHILTIAAIIITMAVGWGVVTTKIEQNAASVRKIELLEDAIDEKITKLREKQAEIDGRIQSLERHQLLKGSPTQEH